MAQVTKMFVEHIQRWLDDEMKKDEQLAAKVQQSGKTADQACNYVLSEVRKSGWRSLNCFDPGRRGMLRK